MKAISFKGTYMPLFPLAVRLKAALRNIRRQVISVRFSKKYNLLWQIQNWKSYNWSWSSRSPGSRIWHRYLLPKLNFVSQTQSNTYKYPWAMLRLHESKLHYVGCTLEDFFWILIFGCCQKLCNPIRGSRKEIQSSGSEIRARRACRSLRGASVIVWFTENSKTRVFKAQGTRGQEWWGCVTKVCCCIDAIAWNLSGMFEAHAESA